MKRAQHGRNPTQYHGETATVNISREQRILTVRRSYSSRCRQHVFAAPPIDGAPQGHYQPKKSPPKIGIISILVSRRGERRSALLEPSQGKYCRRGAFLTTHDLARSSNSADHLPKPRKRHRANHPYVRTEITTHRLQRIRTGLQQGYCRDCARMSRQKKGAPPMGSLKLHLSASYYPMIWHRCAPRQGPENVACD